MIAVKSFLTIFVIAFCITSVHNIEINCVFRYESYYSTSNSSEMDYFCAIWNPAITRLEDKNILTVTGDHQAGKSNKDVKGIKFNRYQDLTFFSTLSQFREVFPSFRNLHFFESNLNGLSSQDLKYFPDLEYFSMNNSKISSIPSTLFQNNKKLKLIQFEGNKELNFIGQDIFNIPSNLQYVRFAKNKCLNEEILAEGRTQINQLSVRISSSSCLSDFDRLQQTIMNLKTEVEDQKKMMIGKLELVNDYGKKITEKVAALENADNYLRKGIDDIVKTQTSQGNSILNLKILTNKQQIEIDEYATTFNETLNAVIEKQKELSEKIKNQGNFNNEVKKDVKDMKNDLMKNIEDVSAVKQNLEKITQSIDKSIEDLKAKIQALEVKYSIQEKILLAKNQKLSEKIIEIANLLLK